MIKPSDEHLRAVERVLYDRKGFRQLFDEIGFDDRAEEDIPEEEEWTPLQREILEDIATAVLNART